MISIKDIVAFVTSDRFLADVTIAMTVIISALHALRLVTKRLRPYVKSSPQKWDDKALTRAEAILDGADALVDAVSFILPRPPRPLNPTPASEREGIEP